MTESLEHDFLCLVKRRPKDFSANAVCITLQDKTEPLSV